MKTKFLISILLVSFCCMQAKASVNIDKTMIENGITYKLNYCVPNDFDETKEYPLIVAMHYCGGTAVQYRTALSGLCDSLKMIIVCPDNKSVVIPESEEHMLVTAIDSSKSFFPIDETKVYLTGMSCNGEYITRHGLNNFYPFKGIFPWDAWITTSNPKTYNFDCKIPIVISVGSDDPNYASLIAVYDSLKAHKANVNLVIVPNVGHSIFNGFSNEMINCIYYLNSNPDFSFEPIENSEVANNDSIYIDVIVNNPGNKKLKYSTSVNNNQYITKTEIIPSNNDNQFKIKVVPNKNRKGGKIIVTIKAFDEANSELAQGFSTIEIKNATTSADMINQNDFEIYPNPVIDNLYFKSKEQNLSINITDVNGKEMINFENVDTRNGIQLQGLPRGFYYLSANGTETTKSIKFLKQ